MASFPKPPTLNDDERAIDIYREAARIIRDQGFDATSMGDIAKAVDLTKGGLYYYIKGKEALLFAIMCFALEQLEKRVVEPAESVADAEERLRRMLAEHLRLMLEETNAMVVLADEIEGLNNEHRQRIELRLTGYTQTLRETVVEVLGTRGQTRLDPAVATGALVSLAEGAVRWFDPDGPVSRADAVEQVTRMALRSLGP